MFEGLGSRLHSSEATQVVGIFLSHLQQTCGHSHACFCGRTMSFEAATSPKVGNIIIPISRRRKLEKKVVEHVCYLPLSWL